MSEDLPAACLPACLPACLHVKQKGRQPKVQPEGRWGFGLRMLADLATWGRVRGSEQELWCCVSFYEARGCLTTSKVMQHSVHQS